MTSPQIKLLRSRVHLRIRDDLLERTKSHNLELRPLLEGLMQDYLDRLDNPVIDLPKKKKRASK